MAIFSKDDYCAEKRRFILGCASGEFPRVSQVKNLRSFGGELAERDFDLDVLEVDIKTRHFKKLTSKKKALAMLTDLKRSESMQMSDYASSSMRSFKNYISRCETHTRHKKIVLAICIILAFLLVSGGVAGAWYADQSGLLYGIGQVSFTADGQAYSQYAVRYNDFVSLTLPEKAGYDIVGVADKKTDKILFASNGVSKERVRQRDLSDYAECSLEVVYTPHLYSATVHAATGATVVSFNYTVEDNPSDVIDEPQHLEGYVFDGWYTDSKYKNQFSGNFMDYINEQLILYPHYSLDGWQITWDLQGGEMLSEWIGNYTILTDVPLPKGGVVKKRGYDFVGWAINGKIIEYFPLTSMQDVLLVAVWETQKYSITYELNGGTLNDDAAICFTIEDIISLSEPIRPAYKFEGWYLDKSFTESIKEIAEGTIGDKIFYAKWAPITYVITYDLAGGENNPLNAITYNAEKDVILYDPQREGYSFLGWYDNQSAIFKDSLCASTDGNIVLVAAWEAKEYVITVYPNNGQESYSKTVKYDDYYSLAIPSYRGYSFTNFILGNEVISSFGIYCYTTDIAILANYTANVYTISFISDENIVATQSVTYGQPYTIDNAVFKANYELVGWYDKPIGGNKVTDGVYNNDFNIVVYASWLKVLTIYLESGNDYTVDNTIEKVYVIGNYNGANSLMADICINVLSRSTDLTMNLINAGFKAKNDCTAIDCQNSSFTLTIITTGISYIEGGNGSDGADGVSGSKMTESNRNGGNGKDGKYALNCGLVIFESNEQNSILTLQAGSGGNGGDGGKDSDRSRPWLNYLPHGGNGGSSKSALNCLMYSVNGTIVNFVKGTAGKGGEKGYRGDWWTICYGNNGKDGTQGEAVSYK